MSRFIEAVAVVVAGACAAAGVATTAQASRQSITASSVPGVIFEECTEHPISYSVSPPPDAHFWVVDFTVQAPDGTSADDFVSASSSRNATTGVVTAEVCGSRSTPGTFTVTGTYKYYQGRVSPTEIIAVPPFTFDMRLPAVAVSAVPSTSRPRLGRTVTVEVKVTAEQPTGDFRGTEARVILQRRTGGRWVKVRGAKDVASGNGVAKVRFTQRWAGRARCRAFANLGYPGRAASTPFVLRTRRPG